MASGDLNTYDVIIIGAGSIGLPTAYFLSSSGLNVLVIDQFASAGQGSNKHAIGGIRATHSDPAKIHLGKRSLEVFSSWKNWTGDDIEWHQGAYSFVAYDPADAEFLRNLVAEQQKSGLNIEWINESDLVDRIPTINPDGLIGGTFSPQDGCASPLLCAFSFHKQAINSGVEFCFNERVEDILVSGDRIIGTRTDQGKYYSAYVINAAGGWANKLSKKIGIDLPIEADSHEAGITEPVQHLFDPMIVDIRKRPGSKNFYFYQHPTGKIIFCLTPDPPIWGTHTIATSDFMPKASRRLIEIMPILQHIRVRRVWRGIYPMTPDGSPIIGKINGLEGYILAAGMCGQGFMFGPGTGKLLTNLVLDQLKAEDRIILSRLTFHRDFTSQEKLK